MKHIKCSKYVAFSHFHGFNVNNLGLIFIAKGNEGINVVDHRFANTDTIKKFNRMIYEHKTELIVSMSNNLNDVI